MEDNHIVFVGDSLARNRLESLLRMLSIVSTHNLVYTKGHDNKFRRWHFVSHNVSVLVYWSPFLVHRVEISNEGPNYKYLDLVDEKWIMNIDKTDLVLGSHGFADLGGNETDF